MVLVECHKSATPAANARHEDIMELVNNDISHLEAPWTIYVCYFW